MATQLTNANICDELLHSITKLQPFAQQAHAADLANARPLMLDVRVLMRKFTLISILFLSSCATQTKDFRALDFGEDCSLISDYESKQKSKIISAHKVAPTYQNIFFGKPAIITYNCTPWWEEKLISAHVNYSFQSFADAVEYYHELAAQLQALYGEPVVKKGKGEDSGPGAQFEGETVGVAVSVMDPPVSGSNNPDGVDIAMTYFPVND